MKGYILNFIIFIYATFYGQKTTIDYNNFDTQTASTMLFEKLNDFRDTITVTGYEKPLTEAWPILKNNRSPPTYSRTPFWGIWVEWRS